MNAAAMIVHRELFHAPWNGQVYNRHFVTIHRDVPREDFRHVVSKGAVDKGLVFDFFWLELKLATQRLDFGHGAGIDRITTT